MTVRLAASKHAKCTRFVAAALAAGLLCATGVQAQEKDPWQGMNRRTFAFNEWLDVHLLMPVARVWDFVTPAVVQTGIANVFATSDMVLVLGNDILQLKPIEAGQDVARAVVNVTVGIAGIFDVASKIGIPRNEEDFGQTLGYWGVPPGPYLVLPVFGPSNPRDTIGRIADTASRPWTYFVEWYVSVSVSVFEFANLRTIYLGEIDDLRRAALDYYVFQRNAYVQSRALAVKDLESIEEEDEDSLYYFEEDEEDGE